jgi:hypothetical protein
MDAKQLTFYVSFGWFKEAHMYGTHMDGTHMYGIGHRFFIYFSIG